MEITNSCWSRSPEGSVSQLSPFWFYRGGATLKQSIFSELLVWDRRAYLPVHVFKSILRLSLLSSLPSSLLPAFLTTQTRSTVVRSAERPGGGASSRRYGRRASTR